MWKSIRNQWISHPLGLLLLLLGYVIGILIISVGTSIIQEARTSSLESTSGNIDHQMYVRINSTQKNIPDLSMLLPKFFGESNQVEVQIGLRGEVANGGGKYALPIVGIGYRHQPEWEVPLINGRHLTPTETQGNQHFIMIGKNVAKQFFANGINRQSSLMINDESYQVIGIIGNEQKASQWDTNIYIPMNALPKKMLQQKQSQLVIGLMANGKSPIDVANHLKKELLQQDASLFVSVEHVNTQSSDQGGRVWNSVITIVLLAGLILLVASINIANLSLFWILDRKKEIGIRKTVGATDATILRMVLGEIMSITIVSAILALILHAVLISVFARYGLTVGVHWENFVISFAVALLCGGLTSLAPVKAALKMEPVEAIKM